MNNVKKTIGWADYTINPVKGLCPVRCSYCYARRMYKRFKWNPEIRYDPSAFNDLPSEPARVFVGSTMELFGDWTDRDWLHMIFAKCLSRSFHTFIFLTKQPQNLPHKFPDNCWPGVSVCNDAMMIEAIKKLKDIEAKVKILSIEPLLDRVDTFWLDVMLRDAGINWLIIGAQTPYSKKTAPKIEWVREIVEAADKAKIPVFLKNNLDKILVKHEDNWTTTPVWASGIAHGCDSVLRQEIPATLPDEPSEVLHIEKRG